MPFRGIFYSLLGFVMAIPLWILIFLIYIGSIFPFVARQVFEKTTDYSVRMETCKTSNFGSNFEINNLVIENPIKTRSSDCLKIKKINTHFRFAGLFGGKLLIEKLEIDLSDMIFVYDQDKNKNNIQLLLNKIEQLVQKSLLSKIHIGIDEFVITWKGSVFVKDYRGKSYLGNEYPIKYERTFKNVSSATKDKNWQAERESWEISKVCEEINKDLINLGFNLAF